MISSTISSDHPLRMSMTELSTRCPTCEARPGEVCRRGDLHSARVNASYRVAKLTNRPKYLPCPGCGKPSIYVRTLDRFIHVDGAEHQDCWDTSTSITLWVATGEPGVDR